MRAAIVLLLALALPAAAADFTVSSTADAIDANPGDGVCADGAGACTLRAAVMEANALAGADRIDVAAGVYQLTIPGLAEEQALTGDLDLTEDVEMRGLGATADDVVLKGQPMEPNDVGRVLHLHAGASLTVRHLTISDTVGGSDTAGDATDADGVAIRSDGVSLVVDDAFFARNNALIFDTGGGAIYAPSGIVRVTRTRFYNNRCAPEGSGGAIRGADIVVEDSEFLGNVADDGGAIEASGVGEALTVRRSRFVGNAAGDNGGAIRGGTSIEDSLFDANFASGLGTIFCAACEIRRSEIRGNTAGDSLLIGAAIEQSLIAGNFTSALFGPDCSVTNSTISGNELVGPLQDSGVPALVQFSSIADNVTEIPLLKGARLRASVVTGNTDVSQSDVCDGSQFDFVSDGFNVIDVADGCVPTATDAFGTSAAPVDPLLAPLADNGGPTRTHALLPGSIAIDRVPTASCVIDADGDPATSDSIPLTSDQREAVQPNGAACDAGAYEAAPVCSDGIDNDGDGRADHPLDSGCASAEDDDEHGGRACDDGVDNDGDGFTDFRILAGAGDPGCGAPTQRREDPRCQDGVDNDLATGIDFDGGASANGGIALDVPDPQCKLPTTAREGRSSGGCGAGPELALLAPLLSFARKRLARRRRLRQT